MYYQTSAGTMPRRESLKLIPEEQAGHETACSRRRGASGIRPDNRERPGAQGHVGAGYRAGPAVA